MTRLGTEGTAGRTLAWNAEDLGSIQSTKNSVSVHSFRH